jgi:hypothetical protein
MTGAATSAAARSATAAQVDRLEGVCGSDEITSGWSELIGLLAIAVPASSRTIQGHRQVDETGS